MVVLDSAQIADFVGLYILDALGRVFDPASLGLYRDDGLLVIPSSNGPETNRVHKKLTKVFKFLGFRFDVTSNIKVVNYLDVTFNLRDEAHRPHSKDGGDPVYVNTSFNQPRSIIEQIPRSANSSTNLISSSKRIFNICKTPYNRALLKSGYPTRDQLTFRDKNTPTNGPKRKRN